jgi:hypothetical protein
MTDTDELLQQDQTVTYAPSASARLLLRVVYIMGIILALLFVALVGGIIWKSTKKTESTSLAGPAVVELGLPAGTAVQSMQLDGDRLAISTGAEIIIVDIRKNAIISRIATNTK